MTVPVIQCQEVISDARAACEHQARSVQIVQTVQHEACARSERQCTKVLKTALLNLHALHCNSQQARPITGTWPKRELRGAAQLPAADVDGGGLRVEELQVCLVACRTEGITI